MASKADRVDSPRDPKQGETQSKLKPGPCVDKASTECEACDQTRGSCIREGYSHHKGKGKGRDTRSETVTMTWAGAMVPFNNWLPKELCVLLALA